MLIIENLNSYDSVSADVMLYTNENTQVVNIDTLQLFGPMLFCSIYIEETISISSQVKIKFLNFFENKIFEFPCCT